MQYVAFRAKGYFIGYSVIEVGCSTVIGQRYKPCARPRYGR